MAETYKAPRNEEPMDNTTVVYNTPLGQKSTWTPTEYQEQIKPDPTVAMNDPSQYLLDVMTLPLLGPFTAAKYAYLGGRALYTAGRSFLSNTAKVAAKEGVKQAVKQAGKQALKYGVKSAPTVVGGALAGVGTDKLSQMLTGQTWGQNASDFLSARYNVNVPTWVGDFTNPGYIIGGKYGYNLGKKYWTPYVDNVVSRYEIANTPLNKNREAIVDALEKNGFQESQQFSGYYENQAQLKINEVSDLVHDYSGNVMIKPSTMTSELHVNPNVRYQFDSDGNVVRVLSTNPVKNEGRIVEEITSKLPSGTVLTQTDEALTIPQIIQNQPLFGRINYYLRGKMPQQRVTEVHGYSPDIMRWFVIRNKRYGDIVLPSVTTRLNGTNNSSEQFSKKFAKYFGTPDAEGNVYFKDMTPEQVELWNKEIAPEYGHYIDPITRTSENRMLITK